MLSKKIVKYIQSLSHKKFRDQEGAFIAEGPKVVSEFLLASDTSCEMLCAEKDWLLGHPDLLRKIPPEHIYETDGRWLKSISLLKTPNLVVGVFRKRPVSGDPGISRGITLLLDDLQDPGNLGTIIRIADWFGLQNIICSQNCVDCYNPKVVQSTMGSLARVRVHYTDLISFVTGHKNIKLYAASLSGTPLFALPKIETAMICIGNESQGVQKDLLGLASETITIPRYGGAESLNAAVASGIILSQLLR
jgi:TrmH family RNA methyltransferase